MVLKKYDMKKETDINLKDVHNRIDATTEAYVAQQWVQLLDDSAQRLELQQAERLEVARHQAVHHLAAQQARLAQNRQAGVQGNVLGWFGSHFGQRLEQHRVASAALVIVVMLVTFFVIQHVAVSNLENSDAFLLASDLPPEAYADKGFDAWLDSN